jgi:acetyl esterase/lipase
VPYYQKSLRNLDIIAPSSTISCDSQRNRGLGHLITETRYLGDPQLRSQQYCRSPQTLADMLVYALLSLFVVWLAVRLFLRAPDHSQFDLPHVAFTGSDGEPSAENEQVLELLQEMQVTVGSVPRRQTISEMRRLMDEGFTGLPADAETLGVRIGAVDIDGMAAEWVVAPRADEDRRLLYLHGGGFFVGSPRSHRIMTAELSRRCRVAVLAIEYRLMPENSRMDSVIDSQTAFRWISDNGPSGPSEAREIYVSGDSAGGNLALMLAAWARDESLADINGVIAFSPSTDSTLAGESITSNIPTDPMLGPALGPFARLPVTLKVLAAYVGSRTNPRNPLVSPLFGDLSDLPPTLVQASESEMLLDDARRYVNKARSQGSPATLQTWPGMVHVWPMFHSFLPEGKEALDQVAKFVARISTGKASAAVN